MKKLLHSATVTWTCLGQEGAFGLLSQIIIANKGFYPEPYIIY